MQLLQQLYLIPPIVCQFSVGLHHFSHYNFNGIFRKGKTQDKQEHE